MTTLTESLVEFVAARYDEDEAAERICAKVFPAPWAVTDRGWVAYVKADAPHFREVARLEQEQVAGGELAWIGDALDHIARHDPDRELREIEAKRRILELHAQGGGPRWVGFPRADRQENYCVHDRITAPCPTVRLLALPYADHEDYREEWAP